MNNDFMDLEKIRRDIKNNSSKFKKFNMEKLSELGVVPYKQESDGTYIFLHSSTRDNNELSDIKFLLGRGVDLIPLDGDVFNDLVNDEDNFSIHKRIDSKLDILKPEENDDESNIETIRFLNSLIEEAIVFNASDIHIEPQKEHIRIRYRIDGSLKTVYRLDNSLKSIIITRFKILGGLDIAERRLPQDGRITFKYENRDIDLRLSVVPTILGEKIVLRILDSHFKFESLASLGLDKDMEEIILKVLNKSSGFILISGPTGAGKSSTIFSMLKILNKDDVNITTIEDPVEYKMDGVNQIQVNYRTGLEFSNTLNHVLRQDPNILTIGEVRDEKTAQIALRAAITGHLVISTVHAASSVLAIDRLMDMKVENYIISSALSMVISQRLVRLLCDSCKTKTIKDTEFYDEPIEVYSPCGCDNCNGGYTGRIGVFELLLVDDDIRYLINHGADSREILASAELKGFISLEKSLLKLLSEGRIDLDEVRRNL